MDISSSRRDEFFFLDHCSFRRLRERSLPSSLSPLSKDTTMSSSSDASSQHHHVQQNTQTKKMTSVVQPGHHHYHDDHSKNKGRCFECGESLGEEAVLALDKLWHAEHFRCRDCRRPIRQTFQEKAGEVFCVACFAQAFNPRCAGCGETLSEACLLALDRHWHPACFLCAGCRRPLPDGQFYLVDQLPYDLDCHWHQRLLRRTRPTSSHDLDGIGQ